MFLIDLSQKAKNKDSKTHTEHNWLSIELRVSGDQECITSYPCLSIPPPNRREKLVLAEDVNWLPSAVTTEFTLS